MSHRIHLEQQPASVDLNVLVAIISSMFQRCSCSSGIFYDLLFLSLLMSHLTIFQKASLDSLLTEVAE